MLNENFYQGLTCGWWHSIRCRLKFCHFMVCPREACRIQISTLVMFFIISQPACNIYTYLHYRQSAKFRHSKWQLTLRKVCNLTILCDYSFHNTAQQTGNIGSWDLQSLHMPTRYSIKLQYIWRNALPIPERVLCFFNKTVFPVVL